MAFKLTRSKTGLEDFTAPAGTDVTLDIEGPKSKTVGIVAIGFGDDIDKTAPFTFTVGALNEFARLLVVFDARVQPGTQLRIVEVDAKDSTKKQVIGNPFFDPKNPSWARFVRAS